jgi:glycosyltransferase involved in cell wall biosynthesis
LLQATPYLESDEDRADRVNHAGPRLPLVLHARVITGAGGGPDKTILNSPRFLGDLGYRSACAFLRPPGDEGFQVIRNRAAAAHAAIEEVDDRGAFDWRVLPRLLEVCRRLRVDVWHAHDYKTNLLGLLLRYFHPLRLVTTCHGWVEFTPRTRLYHRCDRWSLPRYELVISVSEDIVRECHNYGVSEAKSILIENAIDTDQFRRSTSVETAKERLGWPQGRFLVGGAGRLSDEKGFDILIRSIRDLVDRGLDVGLIVAGDGKDRGALNQLVGELKLHDRVRLIGFQSDLRPLYEALDLFALSSRREGLPNVVLEAMALDAPVVSTRVAGVPRLIDDGVNGLLVDLNDQVALTAALEKALAQPELRKQLAAAGRRTIEARYSFAVRMKKVAAVYDELLKPTRCMPPRR